eukprot:4600817-Pyramimonas_sp.AAC.1
MIQEIFVALRIAHRNGPQDRLVILELLFCPTPQPTSGNDLVDAPLRARPNGVDQLRPERAQLRVQEVQLAGRRERIPSFEDLLRDREPALPVCLDQVGGPRVLGKVDEPRVVIDRTHFASGHLALEKIQLILLPLLAVPKLDLLQRTALHPVSNGARCRYNDLDVLDLLRPLRRWPKHRLQSSLLVHRYNNTLRLNDADEILRACAARDIARVLRIAGLLDGSSPAERHDRSLIARLAKGGLSQDVALSKRPTARAGDDVRPAPLQRRPEA